MYSHMLAYVGDQLTVGRKDFFVLVSHSIFFYLSLPFVIKRPLNRFLHR